MPMNARKHLPKRWKNGLQLFDAQLEAETNKRIEELRARMEIEMNERLEKQRNDSPERPSRNGTTLSRNITGHMLRN